MSGSWAPPAEDEIVTKAPAGWTPPAADENLTPSKLDSFGRGAAQGASLGFADEITGGGRAVEQKIIDYLMGNKNGESLKENYKTYRDEMRSKDKSAKEANPKTFTGGEFAGGIATAPLAGEGSIARLAALGAIQGVGNSDADLTEGDFKGAGRDAIIGGATGAAVGGVAKGVGKALDSDMWQKVAKGRALKALGYTKRFLNTPGKQAAADNAAQTMLDEGVVTPLAKPQDMADRVSDLISSSGQKIGSYLRTRGNGYDTNSMVDAIESLRPKDARGMLLEGGHYDDVNGILDKAIKTVTAHGDTIPFEEANALKGVLQKVGKFGSSSGERDIERAIAGRARESIDNSLEKFDTGTPLLEYFPGGAKPREPVIRPPVFGDEAAETTFKNTHPMGEMGKTGETEMLGASSTPKTQDIPDSAMRWKSDEGRMIPSDPASGRTPKDILDNIKKFNELGNQTAIPKETTVLPSEPFKPQSNLGDMVKNQDEFEQFLEQKKIYKGAQEAQDALANRLSSESGNKSMGLTDTIMGSGLAGGEIAAGHLPIGAAAAVASKNFAERYGNQTAAFFADKAAKGLNSTSDMIASALKTSPEKLGKYAGILGNAARQGAQAVTVRHFLLMNTDPEYRQTIKGIDQGQ